MGKIDSLAALGGLGTAFVYVAKPEWLGDFNRAIAATILALAFLVILGRMLYESHFQHPTKGCLVLVENGIQRFFTWRGRTDVHLVEKEEPPKQLLNFFKLLCDTIREQTPMEPVFNLANAIKGEAVYELSKDGKAKWKLLGGMNGAVAEHVLVVNPKKS